MVWENAIAILTAIREYTFLEEVWQQIMKKSPFFCAMLDVQLSILGPSGGLRPRLRVILLFKENSYVT